MFYSVLIRKKDAKRKCLSKTPISFKSAYLSPHIVKQELAPFTSN
jgi:hypothetical protein